MMKKLIAFCAIMMLGNTWWPLPKACAQQVKNIDFFKKMEDSLVHTADSMYNSPLAEWREDHTIKFIRQLKQTLKEPNSIAYSFDSLSKMINIIYAPDKSFRMFNWGVMTNDIAIRYYGALQMNTEQLKLFPLIDHSAEINKGIDDSVFVAPRWFGGIVYNILKREVDGKPVYFMFTKNDGKLNSTFKILDPMIITEKGPVFGLPIFAVASETTKGARANRFVLEFKKGVNAGLNWSEDFQAIVFDRLASIANDPGRKYTYATTGQYDALKWDGRQWNYVQDVMPFTELKDGDMPQGGLDMPK